MAFCCYNFAKIGKNIDTLMFSTKKAMEKLPSLFGM